MFCFSWNFLIVQNLKICSQSQWGGSNRLPFKGEALRGKTTQCCVSDKLGIWHFDTFEWKMMVFVQEKLNMAVSSIVKRWLDFDPAELRNFTDWHDTSLGKLTPILMRSAASTIFRRIILNVCGGGPPVKWERKQKIKTQKKQEGKKNEREKLRFEKKVQRYSSLFHYFLKVVIIYRHFYEKRSTASCGLPYSAKVRHISDFSNR